jgi:RNA polymerase sigma-70 factor (ECF subfamily)
MPSTEELVRAAQAGENSAFAELVRRYQRAVIITAHAVLGDFHSAEDAAQEAFVIAYQGLSRVRNAASFGPWLLKIARRRAVRLRRGKNSVRTGTPCVGCAATQTTQTRNWMGPDEEVVQQLARLPEQERIVAVMRYVDGRSMKEIADATGRPVGTVTKQLSRAVQRLRAWFVEVES